LQIPLFKQFHIRHLRRLQWKLALFYALITTAALTVLVLWLLADITYYTNWGTSPPQKIQEAFLPLDDDVIEALIHEPPITARLQNWAEATFYKNEGFLVVDETHGREWTEVLETLTILDEHGVILAQANAGSDTPILLSESADFLAQLQAWPDKTPQYVASNQNYVVPVVIPLWEQDRKVGFIVVEVLRIDSRVILDFLKSFGITVGMVLLVCLLIGSIYGYLSSRGVVRRLNELNKVAKQWAQGQFNIQIATHAGDEIDELGQNLNHMANQLQTLIKIRQQFGALDERARIARELHDTVKQQVFATQMYLSSVRLVIKQDPDEATQILDTTIQLNQQIQTELVSLIHALRPFEVEREGLTNALKAYIVQWEIETKAKTIFSIQGERKVPLNVEIVLYRIAQEALNNIAKHAQAQRVTLELSYEADSVRLLITDDGQGFKLTEQPSTGYGLTSMRERLAEVNGQLEIGSHAEEGTLVTATVPLNS